MEKWLKGMRSGKIILGALPISQVKCKKGNKK